MSCSFCSAWRRAWKGRLGPRWRTPKGEDETMPGAFRASVGPVSGSVAEEFDGRALILALDLQRAVGLGAGAGAGMVVDQVFEHVLVQRPLELQPGATAHRPDHHGGLRL